MKRTTIVLPDDLAALLEREQRRQGTSTAAVVRAALEAYLAPNRQPKRLGFVGLGRTGTQESVARNVEEILAAGYADDIARESGLSPWHGPVQSPDIVTVAQASAEDEA
ncbi:MAG TPA: CopG family transcriptional regulator [Thermomicrobiales bacterium]|nr:CopG family transcriptional regulator [Thermomicrobiales bacterium]